MKHILFAFIFFFSLSIVLTKHHQNHHRFNKITKSVLHLMRHSRHHQNWFNLNRFNQIKHSHQQDQLPESYKKLISIGDKTWYYSKEEKILKKIAHDEKMELDEETLEDLPALASEVPGDQGALEVLEQPKEPEPTPGTGYFRIPNDHRQNMYKLEFAKMPGKLFLDQVKQLLQINFQSEIDTAYNAFKSIPAPPETPQKIPGWTPELGVTYLQLKQGMVDFKWKIHVDDDVDDKAWEMATKYDIDYHNYLNRTAFGLMLAETAEVFSCGKSECQNCLSDTIKKLDTFYDQVNCGGRLTAEEIHQGIKEFFGVDAKTVPINDFVLKADKNYNYTLDKIEFIQGFLKGLWESEILLK